MLARSGTSFLAVNLRTRELFTAVHVVLNLVSHAMHATERFVRVAHIPTAVSVSKYM